MSAGRESVALMIKPTECIRNLLGHGLSGRKLMAPIGAFYTERVCNRLSINIDCGRKLRIQLRKSQPSNLVELDNISRPACDCSVTASVPRFVLAAYPMLTQPFF
jgi:hypothetical protein